MKRAEQVTFGGSGLDRAAHLRSSPEALTEQWNDPRARVLALWRGKPLVAGANAVYLPIDAALVKESKVKPLFVGIDEGGPIFATDVSHWVPEAGDTPDQTVFFDPSHQHHPDFPADHVFSELRGIMASMSPRDAEIIATAKAIFNWHRSHKFCAACGAPSQIVMGGWQRNCPDCDTSHFPRTDPVVIMLITSGNDVLLGRSPGWPDKMYSLLAGFVEPGETIEAAVRREVLEESAVKVGAVDYLSCQPWPYPNSLMIGCRGEALSRDITIDPKELEDAIWMSREDVARAFAGAHEDMLEPRQGAIAHFLLSMWLSDRLD